jgi:hypothetical protein
MGQRLVTKAHDVQDVARAIMRLAGDRNMRMRMGKEARQSVVDRSWAGRLSEILEGRLMYSVTKLEARSYR